MTTLLAVEVLGLGLVGGVFGGILTARALLKRFFKGGTGG